MAEHWNLVLEAAVEFAVDGRREILPTGDAEPGLRATLPRSGERHGLHAAASVVRYGAGRLLPGDSRRAAPTGAALHPGLAWVPAPRP